MSEGVAIGIKTAAKDYPSQSKWTQVIKYLFIGETALSIILQLKKMRSLVAQVKLRVTNQVLKSFFSFFFFVFFRLHY